MTDIEQGDVTETKPDVDQEDITEFRSEIDQIDITGTDATDVP